MHAEVEEEDLDTEESDEGDPFPLQAASPPSRPFSVAWHTVLFAAGLRSHGLLVAVLR